MSIVRFKTRAKQFAVNTYAIKWVEPTEGETAIHLTDDTLYVDLPYNEVVDRLNGVVRVS